MKTDIFFSWDNISEVTDVDSHIIFASSLLDKYDWDDKTKESINRQLKIIERKKNDKKLNICVIGEFSTGKSSFINALVGHELLEVNVIQGTTVAITVIEYSPDYSIFLSTNDGTTTRKTYDGIEELRKDLKNATTDPQYGQQIDHIVVTLPSPILKEGFRIIDTPGTNSLELWHEDVTKRAIGEWSDLSIILTDASKPMSETLLSFIDSTLGGSIRDCAFLVNKIDLLKKKERDGILEYVKQKAQDLDIENPTTLPFSSVALTNDFSAEKVAVDRDDVTLSTNSLDKLLTYTAHNKMKAQARRTLSLINTMYSTLNDDMTKILDDYNGQLQMLEHTKHTDLQPFINTQIELRQKQFLDNAKDKIDLITTKADTLVSSAINRINSKINQCKDLDALSQYTKENLSLDIIQEGQTLASGIGAEFGDAKDLFIKEIEAFQESFKEEFKKKRILSVIFSIEPNNVPVNQFFTNPDITQAKVLSSEELSKENWAFGVGIVSCTVIGSAICPGIGTAIGFFTGLFAGYFMAPKEDKVKENVRNKLSIPLRTYYDSVSNDCVSSFNKYVNRLNTQLEAEILRYYSTYNTIVDQELAQWKEAYTTIQVKIQGIQQDMAHISKRQAAIQSLIVNL